MGASKRAFNEQREREALRDETEKMRETEMREMEDRRIEFEKSDIERDCYEGYFEYYK